MAEKLRSVHQRSGLLQCLPRPEKLHPVGEHNVFAAQLIGQFGSGDLPFNELGLIGGETIMRGYYLGRYRDRNLFAGQIEMRFLPFPLGFTNRIGGSVFLASGTVAPSLGEFAASDLRVTGGFGLRVLTFPSSDIFSRLAVGFSADGPGFYPVSYTHLTLPTI